MLFIILQIKVNIIVCSENIWGTVGHVSIHRRHVFIARLVVLTKVLELCRSKIQFTEANHAESKEVQHRSGHYAGVFCSTGQIDGRNTVATPGIPPLLNNRNESTDGSIVV